MLVISTDRDELEKTYNLTSPIRHTALFTAADILELKQYAKISLPWEDGGMAYASGIPPHTLPLAGNEEIKKMLKDLLPTIEQFMDDRTMSGNLFETRMKSLIESERNETKQQLNTIQGLLEWPTILVMYSI